jgi:hypothetical protein
MNTDNFLAIRDKKDPRRGETGFFSLHEVLGGPHWRELKRKFEMRKSDPNTICSKELTKDILQNSLSGEVHEEIHIDGSLHDNILQGFATFNRDLDKTKLYTFVPKKK